MAKHTPHTQSDIKEMLSKVGKKGTSQLLVSVPDDYYIPECKWPDGVSESEAYQQINGMSIKNRAPECTFMGAGIYKHYIPVGVSKLIKSERLMNAPSIYEQPNQVLMQGVYECQQMLSNLVGMPYVSICATDAAVALAHACLSLREEGKNKILISTLIKPNIKKVLDCYLQPYGITVNYVDALGSKISTEALTTHLTEEVIALYIEQPNFYGTIEDVAKISTQVHSAGAKLVVGVNPISLALLKKPIEYGADIAVGDCQCLGLPISHGSNTMGFMACGNEYQERLLGDIIVKESDGDNNPFYRIKRVGGITTQIDARKAVIVGAYLAYLGIDGLKKIASASVSNAHYLKFELAKAGIGVKYKEEYFNEFVTLSKCTSESILAALAQEGITGGHKISTHEILWCTTELHTREQMDRCAEICGGVNQ